MRQNVSAAVMCVQFRSEGVINSRGFLSLFVSFVRSLLSFCGILFMMFPGMESIPLLQEAMPLVKHLVPRMLKNKILKSFKCLNFLIMHALIDLLHFRS